jgi:organic radical activating enzyme
LERFEKSYDHHDTMTQYIQQNKLYDHQKQQFWSYLIENDRFKVLTWFNLLGGEPLVIPELDECLDFWDNHPNENLTFQLHTNLKINDYRFDKFLSRIEKLTKQKKVYQFKIVASLDGLGPQQEYVRYGLDTKQWIRNFEKLLKIPNVSVGINSAISALTLHEFPPLLEKIIEWNKDRRNIDRIVHSFVIDMDYTTPYMFNIDVFEDTIERCKKLFIVKSNTDLAIKKRWEGFELRFNNSIKDLEKIKRLKKYLSELDKRRNTDWKKTFPWLVNL